MDTRILIFTGGDLGLWALDHIQPTDFVIGVDRGALFLLQHLQRLDYALGDFDSVSELEFASILEACPSLSSCDPIHKDLTDTEMAITWAIEQRPAEILLLGALGSRFDHSLANVHLLRKALQAHIPCKIVDANNEIQLTDHHGLQLERGDYSHVSLLPLTLEVTGITLEGFQYPLHEATLTIGDSLGISNIIKGSNGSIQLRSGELLIIQSKD